MRAQDFILEDAVHRGGIDVEEHEDAEDPSAIWITASTHGRDLGHVRFYRSGDTLTAQSLEVEPEYRGQGIARIMYDYAKELGYRVLRSAEQTDAGAGFWDKYRGRTGVWEQEIMEAREGVMNILRDELPGWPDYVIKDMIYSKLESPMGLEMKLDHVRELALEVGSWRQVQRMPLTFDMLDPDTQNRMRQRKFGDANPFKIPNDRDRLEHAMWLVKEKGIENLPPVIFKQTPQGLDLWEGWHRVMAAFRQHPKGFRVNAWIGQPGRVNEVQILAKVKGKGSEPGQLPKFGREILPDQQERYLGQQVGRMGRYSIWQDWLGGQLSYHLFDPRSRTAIVTTFGSRYHGNPQSYIIHGLYAAPGNPVKAHQFYRALIKDLGLTLISDRKQSPGGNRVWQRLEAYPDIEVYGFDTKTGEVMNFGAQDSEMYAVPPRAAKDRESKYIAKNIRLVATAR